MSNDNRNNEYREELERAIQEFKEKHGKKFEDFFNQLSPEDVSEITFGDEDGRAILMIA